jgi:hypothetical protein
MKLTAALRSASIRSMFRLLATSTYVCLEATVVIPAVKLAIYLADIAQPHWAEPVTRGTTTCSRRRGQRYREDPHAYRVM